MSNYKRFVGAASVAVIISLFALASSASAFWDGFPFVSPSQPPSEQTESRLPFKFCERTISAAGISIKFNLPSKKCDTPPPPPPPPEEEEEPTLEFSAEPTTIDEGDSSTLEWDSDNADTCTASGGWSGSKALSGTQQVSPTATTTYTLTCENDEGEVEKSATVNVILAGPGPVAPTLDFTADPETVNQGSSTVLEWESNNTDSCTASGGWAGDKTLIGSELVTPTATTTYTLECEGEGGEVTKNVTVGVILPPEEPEPEANIVINEIAWMGSMVNGATSSAAEWIELRNLGEGDVDLTDWTLTLATTSGASPDEIVISLACENTTISGGGFYLLVRNSIATSTLATDCVYSGAASTALANTGEIVELHNASSESVDVVDGSDGWKINGDDEVIGNNDTKETAQRGDDGIWFTASPTPGASNE